MPAKNFTILQQYCYIKHNRRYTLQMNKNAIFCAKHSFLCKKYAKMYKYTQKCEKYLYFMQNWLTKLHNVCIIR